MHSSFTIESKKFSSALGAYVARTRRDASTVLRQQAKLLVQDIYKITPPNSAKSGAAEGKAAVKADILKVLRPGRGEKIHDADPALYHTRFRVSRGRVLMRLKKSGKDGRIRVTRSVLLAYIKEKQEKVGWLAAGWNVAARQLGARVPAFAAKHGSGIGAIRVRLSGDQMFIEMRNQVRFAGTVRDLQRRVNFALGRRAEALTRQLTTLIQRSASGV